MSEKATHPRAAQTAITLVLGFGRAIATTLMHPLGAAFAPGSACPDRRNPALYGLALTESPRMAPAPAGRRLVMSSMTFGLERPLQPQKEEAAA